MVRIPGAQEPREHGSVARRLAWMSLLKLITQIY